MRPSKRTDPRLPHQISATTPLIGRRNTIDTLSTALQRGSSLITIEGDAGVGKSRLLRETLSTLDGDPRRQLIATCPAVVEPFPLGAIVDGVRRQRPDVADLDLSPLGGALRPLYPEWTDVLPQAPEPLYDPRATRHRLYRALSELIERMGVDVLVVEDVHWADTATLEWLIMLATDEPAADHRLSIVVSYRPWEVPADSLLPRLTTRTAPGVSRSRIGLEPLNPGQIRELVSAVYQVEVSEQFAVFLHSVTDGIPLVVEEYLLLLEDRDDIRHDGDRWIRRALTELDVPPTVRESVLERVHRLTDGTRRLLESASVYAAPIDATTLARMAELPPETVRTGLAEALNSGLLRETSAGRFSFRHNLDAQAIGETMPISERRRLHEHAADALRADAHPPVARLAHHLREAGNIDLWCEYAETSADLALQSGDDRTAVETLLQVMTSTDHPIERSAQLARKLGDAAFFGMGSLGDLGEPVVQVLRRVLESPDITATDRGELRLLLGRMSWELGDRRAAFALWELAVSDLDQRPASALRAMANMALPLVPDWPVSRHLYWLERARGLLGEVEPDDLQAYQDMHMSALLLLGEADGWTAVQELPETASNADERLALSGNVVSVIWAVMAWGHMSYARRRLEIAARFIDPSEYSRLDLKVQAARARLDWHLGNWSGLHDRVSALIDNDDVDAISALHARQVRALLRLAVDGTAALTELSEAAAERARTGVTEPEGVAVHAALARLRLATGDWAGAFAIAEPVVTGIVDKGVWLWITDIAPAYVTALLGMGDVDRAETFVSAFGNALTGRDLPAPEAALATCRALLAQATNSSPAAEEFDSAASKWAVMSRSYDELLCLEGRATALLAGGDKSIALELLTRVQQRLQDLGARWDADRVARLARDHGAEVVRTWRGGRRGYGNRLSPRELEVVRLVVQGTSNREAAALLFLSPRTVEGHVKSAMRKLGVKSRTALAIAAVESGQVAPGRHPDLSRSLPGRYVPRESAD
ncbi:AAA ATPase-like protein [Stackebrandtia endophytica]|uniref:AAA ATPase-like protein n=1 Tax=Stackebrandtia endophytica TaxID=1496996 RepID=A0A543AS49_9ACTN|nr:LuxR C-terminal-related transcriptional regulator [Stackebrandtia endophytica]TQL75413.1 AAA ATPase-like protein [Stackebrandtia endophytica]